VAALAALRSFDDKALLSYVLNQAAEYHLTCGELEPAGLRRTRRLPSQRSEANHRDRRGEVDSR